MSVAICIPSIPSRADMLAVAVHSVVKQTTPCQVSVEIDHERRGAWHTRNVAVRKALRWDDAEWIGFLDDDDYLLPHHVGTLIEAAQEQSADVVWSWFHVEGGTDPFPQHRGRQWDPDDPHIFPIAYLVRAHIMREAMYISGGFQPDTGHGTWEAQDYPMVEALWRASHGRFHGIEDITWVWRHHGANTSGMPNR